jgi:hypothetical protein
METRLWDPGENTCDELEDVVPACFSVIKGLPLG